MRGNWKRLTALLAGAVVAVGLVAAPAVAHQQRALDNNRKSDNLFGGGSDTTYNMLVQLDALYNRSYGCPAIANTGAGEVQNEKRKCQIDTPGTITTENYDHDQTAELFPIGSSAGIKMLCDQGTAAKPAPLDWARSSRAPKSGTDCAGLRFVAYARDAIPWVHYTGAGSSSASLTNLTQAQIQGIFVNCTITFWDQVNGALPHQPIDVWAAPATSGTKATFDGFIGGNAYNCIPAQYKDGNLANGEHITPVENDVAPIVAAGDQNNAIFYSSYGRFTQTNPTNWAMGSIDGVAPTPTTIQDASYPYGRFLYNVYRSTTTAPKAKGAAVDYVSEKDGWLCKPSASHATDPDTGLNYRTEIENIITASGFVPLPTGAIGGGVSGTSYCRALALTT